MSDFLMQNLNTLRQCRPWIFKSIEDFYRGVPDAKGVDGSGIKKQMEAEGLDAVVSQSLDLSPLKHPKILVCHGIGLGYHLFKALREKPHSIRHILIVEKNLDVFISTLKLHDLTEWITSPEFEFFVAVPASELVSYAIEYLMGPQERVIYADRMENLYFKPSLDHEGDYYVAVARSFQEALQQITDKGQFAPGEDNWRGLLNLLRNQSVIERSPMINKFRGHFPARRQCWSGQVRLCSLNST